MKKLNLLVVDSNVLLVDALKEYFNKGNSIQVSYTAYDGLEAIDILSKHDDIDMVILDVLLPKKDGIYVLEEMKKRGINKKVIVTTGYDSNDVVEMVAKLGANYFISKPYELEDLESRINLFNNIKDTKTNISNNNLQITISKLLHDLGIPSHIKGYQYIREGIMILYDRPNLVGSITKKLYPELAEKYDTTTSRVERAMRHAIEVGWLRSDWKMTDDLFGQSVDYDKAKPTNSEFLVTLADKLRLDNKIVV